MSDQKCMLDAYYRERAQHFMCRVLMPLIRSEVKSPTIDVAGSAAVSYAINAVRVSQLKLAQKPTCAIPN